MMYWLPLKLHQRYLKTNPLPTLKLMPRAINAS
ncbi:hypothetical protein BrE312_3299 [Brenneria sp. EniD312]|nr:hypothetical protein BrE312_3299 [Brenneria sp. EniD312]